MLQIKSTHTPRISNSFAVFAALLLLVSAMAGFGDSAISSKVSADQEAENETASTQIFASESPGGNTHKENKSFKVSLFLFRID